MVAPSARVIGAATVTPPRVKASTHNGRRRFIVSSAWASAWPAWVRLENRHTVRENAGRLTEVRRVSSSCVTRPRIDSFMWRAP